MLKRLVGLVVLVLMLLILAMQAAQAESVIPNTASDLDQWNLLVTLAAPFIIAALHQPIFGPWLRVAVTAAVCVVASLITTALNGDLTLRLWLHSLIIVLVGAVALYHTLFSSVVAKVEDKTNVARAPARHEAVG